MFVYVGLCICGTTLAQSNDKENNGAYTMPLPLQLQPRSLCVVRRGVDGARAQLMDQTVNF